MEKGQSPERITKRIQQREAEKEALEKQLAKEKRKQPTLQLEHILAFLNYLRDLPGTDKVKRKTLITIFVNSVYLYDDYFTIIFNAGNATLRAENIPRKSIENSLKQAVNKTSSGSGAVNCIPPKRRAIQMDGSSFWYGIYVEGNRTIQMRQSGGLSLDSGLTESTPLQIDSSADADTRFLHFQD
jgi:hypothetical protein